MPDVFIQKALLRCAFFTFLFGYIILIAPLPLAVGGAYGAYWQMRSIFALLELLKNEKTPDQFFDQG